MDVSRYKSALLGSTWLGANEMNLWGVVVVQWYSDCRITGHGINPAPEA